MDIRVLFIEDEPHGVMPYFKVLDHNGFRCLLAINGDQAVHKLMNSTVDLICMDVMFHPGEALPKETPPTRSGLRLLEKIRSGSFQHCPRKIPVIILTAVTDPEIEFSIKSQGVEAYLTKPIAFDKVIDQFFSLKHQLFG